MNTYIKTCFLERVMIGYIKAMHPEIRKVWDDYMKNIVETIYKINKPVTQKVRLTRMNSNILFVGSKKLFRGTK